MKWINGIIACSMLMAALSACDLSTYSEEEEDSDNIAVHEDSTDYTWDEADVVTITLADNTSSVSGSGASVSGNIITVSQPGTYSFSGTLSNGQILVNATDSGVVRLILDGVTITTASSSPVYIKNATKAIIILADNSDNTLTDGTSYVYDDATEEEPNATIFSKENLTIYGSGALTIKGNFNDGINSKDGLVIRGGYLNITATDDGIRGKDYLYIAEATLTVKAGGDGLKSDEEEDTSRGYIVIDSGIMNITSSGDAITAQSNLTINDGTFTLTSGGGSNYTVNSSASAKGIKGLATLTINDGTFTISTADDALHTNGTLSITGGTMAISAADDGLHAETSVTVDDGVITIAKSYEGVESKLITINGGTISVTATNDAINATAGTTSGGTEQNDGSYFYMYGGTLVASCSKGDAIDSNGSFLMTGDTIIAHGPSSQPEEAVDINGSFTMKGGYFVGAGPYSNMFKTMSSSSTQRNLAIVNSKSSSSASTLIHIQDASGNNIVTFKPSRASATILFSSADLETGVTYSLYTGGTCTGTLSNGLYSDGTYSGGTLKKSFTLSTSGTVTSVSL